MAENTLRNSIVEFFGTMILLVSIVGSGFMASELSDDSGVVLLTMASVISLTLLVLIYVLMPVSGAFFNPAVVLLAVIKKEMKLAVAVSLVVAQILGAISGSLLANYFFTAQPIQTSNIDRISSPVFVAEVLATFGLIFIIAIKKTLVAEAALPFLIPAWIFAAIFFTSSTAFANPAVTIARYFTDSVSGIAISSVPWFILAEVLGALLAVLAGRALLMKKLAA
ncbi:MAG: aquaporin [Candidatus Nanopelagicales bacterium]